MKTDRILFDWKSAQAGFRQRKSLFIIIFLI